MPIVLATAYSWHRSRQGDQQLGNQPQVSTEETGREWPARLRKQPAEDTQPTAWGALFQLHIRQGAHIQNLQRTADIQRQGNKTVTRQAG